MASRAFDLVNLPFYGSPSTDPSVALSVGQPIDLATVECTLVTKPREQEPIPTRPTPGVASDVTTTIACVESRRQRPEVAALELGAPRLEACLRARARPAARKLRRALEDLVTATSETSAARTAALEAALRADTTPGRPRVLVLTTVQTITAWAPEPCAARDCFMNPNRPQTLTTTTTVDRATYLLHATSGTLASPELPERRQDLPLVIADVPGAGPVRAAVARGDHAGALALAAAPPADAPLVDRWLTWQNRAAIAYLAHDAAALAEALTAASRDDAEIARVMGEHPADGAAIVRAQGALQLLRAAAKGEIWLGADPCERPHER